MAIDINKSGNGGNASQLDYNDPNSSNEVREIYRFAYECKQKNMPDYQIEQSLMNRGLDVGQVTQVMRNVNQAYNSRQQASSQSDNGGGGGGAGIPRIVYYIGILILINVLSAVFGWGFWIY